MEHRALSNKLDSLSYGDLQIQFDEGRMWEKLEARLDHQKAPFPYRWMVAAAVFLAVFFLPLTLLKENLTTYPTSVAGVEPIGLPLESLTIDASSAMTSSEDPSVRPSVMTTASLPSKGISTVPIVLQIPELELTRVPSVTTEKIKPQFALEDISVIQSNLRKASVNDLRLAKGKRMSISAQWQSSAFEESTENSEQAVTIKLNETRQNKQNKP